MAAAPQQNFQPTDRVLIAKQRATVRYVGPVDGYEGAWVGVEWDDSSRGKHDGETGGKRYFTCCSDAATAASFVRINKVSPGISLVEALVLRYTNQLAEGQSAGTAAADAQPAIPASNRKLWVELVGQEQVTARQSKLELLTSARLVGANVSSVGPHGKLSATATSLRQLDLTDNLIGGWSTVVSICQQLPQLQLLNLSLNRLQLLSSLPDAGLQQLPGLQCLVLNSCNITWQQVAVLQSSLPNLQELHVAGNSISSLLVRRDQPSHDQQQQQQQHDWPPLEGFRSLQVLGLEDNAISSWQEVLRLAGLPNLQRLALSGNPISSIAYPAAAISTAALFSTSPPDPAGPSGQQQQQATASPPAGGTADCQQQPQEQQQQQQAPFARLQALLLGDCRISSWADVDQLDRFPALRELRLSGNPLFSAEGCGAGGGRRFEVIGRVSGLTLLNGADVKPRERRDCELRYLQNVLAEQAEATAAAAAAGQKQQQESQQEAVAVQHPRVAQLMAQYGQVSAVAPVANLAKQQGSSLSSTTCELLLRCGGATARKKLPRSVTVAGLRLLCARLFKLAPDQIQLLLVGPAAGGDPQQQQEEEQEEDIGQDDTKQLSYWDVVDGSTVRVLAVDPEQQRQQRDAEQAARQVEHERRMAQQLQEGEALRSAAAAAAQ